MDSSKIIVPFYMEIENVPDADIIQQLPNIRILNLKLVTIIKIKTVVDNQCL